MPRITLVPTETRQVCSVPPHSDSFTRYQFEPISLESLHGFSAIRMGTLKMPGDDSEDSHGRAQSLLKGIYGEDTLQKASGVEMFESHPDYPESVAPGTTVECIKIRTRPSEIEGRHSRDYVFVSRKHGYSPKTMEANAYVISFATSYIETTAAANVVESGTRERGECSLIVPMTDGTDPVGMTFHVRRLKTDMGLRDSDHRVKCAHLGHTLGDEKTSLVFFSNRSTPQQTGRIDWSKLTETIIGKIAWLTGFESDDEDPVLRAEWEEKIKRRTRGGDI